VASSICLRATISQNPEWTLWTHCIYKQLPLIHNGRSIATEDHLCGLVVKVPGYRSRGSGLDSRALQEEKKVVGLERGPLSLVSTTEQLLGRIVAASV
jgi:hypothetical protein